LPRSSGPARSRAPSDQILSSASTIDTRSRRSLECRLPS
jgi:hypothetical protein